jgi:hypothetical protein
MSVDKPNQQYPMGLGSFQSMFPAILPDPSIRGDAFDQLLNNRGIRFIHKIAAPCPNVNVLDDNNHDPECPFCDQSQILHVEEREIWGVLSNNTLEKLYEIQGVWEVGTAVITFPTHYNGGTEQADFNVFDQLICPDFQVRLSDLKAYEGDMVTKCKYPIVRAVNITSISGGTLKTYAEGVDYTVVDGNISWIAGKQPSYNQIEEIGEVLSITYVANPVYNVVQTLHELRVTQELIGGVKTAIRLPQQVLVKRDFLYKPDNK